MIQLMPNPSLPSNGLPMAFISSSGLLLAFALYGALARAAPAGSSVAVAPATTQTAPYASDDPNAVICIPNDPNIQPEPIRGKLKASILGPQNVEIDRQNPDLLAPPTTDHGTVANAKWPFSLSHNRLQAGGWARQQNVDVLPVATETAGVNMRLDVGAIRELHWHETSEWAYVLKGHVQITAVNTDGQNHIAVVKSGDLWYFPPGIPHSLQAQSSCYGWSYASFTLYRRQM